MCMGWFHKEKRDENDIPCTFRKIVFELLDPPRKYRGDDRHRNLCLIRCFEVGCRACRNGELDKDIEAPHSDMTSFFENAYSLAVNVYLAEVPERNPQKGTEVLREMLVIADEVKNRAEKGLSQRAEYACAQARLLLAHCYADGRGCRQNTEKACRLYMRAFDDAALLDKDVPLLYKKGSGTEEEIVLKLIDGYPMPVQLEFATALAYDMIKRNKIMGAVLLGEILNLRKLDWKKLGQSPEEDFMIYLCGAKENNLYALYRMGRCMAEGFGTEQNREQALKFLKAASDSGSFFAARYIGHKLQQDKRYWLDRYQQIEEDHAAFLKSMQQSNADLSGVLRAYRHD